MDEKPLYVTFGGAKQLNLDPKKEDQFYRYKVHQLTIQVIGKGKMIKTAFLNLDKVAKEMKVPPEYLPNYVAQLIGAKAKYDPKMPIRERGHISGEHQLPLLNDYIVNFINQFVLCPKCRLPELQFRARKKMVHFRCKGCGERGLVSDMPLPEKFKRFVINHPPVEDVKKAPDAAKPSAKKGAKKRRGDDDDDDDNEEGAEANGGDDDGDGDANGDDDAGGEEDDEDEDNEDDNEPDPNAWSTDTSEAAAAARAEEMLPEALKALVVVPVVAPSTILAPNVDRLCGGETGAKLHTYVLEHASSPTEVAEEFARVAAALNFTSPGSKDMCQLLVDQIMPGMDMSGKELVAFVKAHRALFAQVLTEDPENQMQFISAFALRFSRVQGEGAPTTFADFPKAFMLLLKGCYDLDLVDEEAISGWFGSKQDDSMAGCKALKEALAPFVKWLEEASEEESDE